MAFIQMKLSSRELQSKTDITVILPGPSLQMVHEDKVDYRFFDVKRKYQVLYLYHGTCGDCFDWIRFSKINTYAQKYNLAVIMPSVQNSSFHNLPGSYAYFNYVTKELPTIMHWMFPISAKRENSFIAGLSMGGMGAFKVAMLRPELYSSVACLSASFNFFRKIEEDRTCLHAAAFDKLLPLTETEEDPYWISERLREKGEDYPNIYIGCGTEDNLTYDSNQEMRRHLDKIGMKYTYHEQPGGHDWNFWDSEMEQVIKWLPLKGDLIEE